MQLHAAYFLKCPQAAEWLNTPETPRGVAKEFLDGSRSVSSYADPPPPLSSAKRAPWGTAERLFVPVELFEHFVFGVALGPIVPPPRGADPKLWHPVVNRFVLDAGRKCCLIFSYFADGSIVVSVDCFDEIGDHFSELIYFHPTPIVGVFPRGIRARMTILERRDCPACAHSAAPCACSDTKRLDALILQRSKRARSAGPWGSSGPASGGVHFTSEQVTISTYPNWSQNLDMYVNSHIGSYVVHVESSDTVLDSATTSFNAPPRKADPFCVSYRATYALSPRSTVDRILKSSLFDQGLTPLKPPATDVRWETSNTITVSSSNVVVETQPPKAAFHALLDWHKLPGLQHDYLLVAPSNIVSSARARAEYLSAEAQRRAMLTAAGMGNAIDPDHLDLGIPRWASGMNAVLEQAITNAAQAQLDEAPAGNPLVSFTYRNDGLVETDGIDDHSVSPSPPSLSDSPPRAYPGPSSAAGPSNMRSPNRRVRIAPVPQREPRQVQIRKPTEQPQQQQRHPLIPWLPSRAPHRAAMPSARPRSSRKRSRRGATPGSSTAGPSRGCSDESRSLEENDPDDDDDDDDDDSSDISRSPSPCCCRPERAEQEDVVDSITGYVRYEPKFNTTIESNVKAKDRRKKARLQRPVPCRPPPGQPLNLNLFE